MLVRIPPPCWPSPVAAEETETETTTSSSSIITTPLRPRIVRRNCTKRRSPPDWVPTSSCYNRLDWTCTPPLPRWLSPPPPHPRMLRRGAVNEPKKYWRRWKPPGWQTTLHTTKF
eukprot:Pompholyxophrys_punicea_v1_NODE_6_length_8794_cov_7.233894.p11 type:complete len:115 gc:universal NODE_6_length_8794_cov_7.233894:4232-3888(-)